VNQTQDRYERLAVLERQMTSGLLLEKPSDDPQRASEIIAAQNRLNRSRQYLKNSQALAQELMAVETAVGQVSDLVARVRSAALQGANGTLSAADREALAREVDGELDELLRIANQRYGSSYLFGGSSIDAVPFQTTRDDKGNIIAVTLPDAEVAAPLKRLVEEDQTLENSLSPSELFDLGDGDDVFRVIIELRNALRAGDGEALNRTLDRLQGAVDLASSATTLIGSHLQTAQSTVERLQASNLQDENRLSRLADADAIDTITRYNQEQAAYEMALKTAARVIQPTLLDFL